MVAIPNSMFDLQHTPIFEWCMVGCESNEHKKNTCLINHIWNIWIERNDWLSIKNNGMLMKSRP